MNSIKRVLIVGAVLAAVGLGFTNAVLQSELKAQTAIVDKQVVDLANKQLEVDGLTSDVQFLNEQATELNQQAELVAGLNAQHQQSEENINDQHLVAMINSNELKVSEHDPTRAWANTALPDAAGQLLYQATGSTNYHRDKDSDGTTTSKLSTVGMRTASL